jgi:hypothetical protein
MAAYLSGTIAQRRNSITCAPILQGVSWKNAQTSPSEKPVSYFDTPCQDCPRSEQLWAVLKNAAQDGMDRSGDVRRN